MLYSFYLGIDMNLAVSAGQADNTAGPWWQPVNILLKSHISHTGHLRVLQGYLHSEFFFHLHFSTVKLQQIWFFFWMQYAGLHVLSCWQQNSFSYPFRMASYVLHSLCLLKALVVIVFQVLKLLMNSCGGAWKGICAVFNGRWLDLVNQVLHKFVPLHATVTINVDLIENA